MVQPSGQHRRLWVGRLGHLVIAGSQQQPAGFQRWTLYRRQHLYAWCFTVLCCCYKINAYCFVALSVFSVAELIKCSLSSPSNTPPADPLHRPGSFTTTAVAASAELPAEEGEYWFFHCAAVISLLLHDYVSWAGPGLLSRPLANFHFDLLTALYKCIRKVCFCLVEKFSVALKLICISLILSSSCEREICSGPWHAPVYFRQVPVGAGGGAVWRPLGQDPSVSSLCLLRKYAAEFAFPIGDGTQALLLLANPVWYTQ